jgi:hypothetical protein
MEVVKFYKEKDIEILIKALELYNIRKAETGLEVYVKSNGKNALEAFAKLSPVSVPEFDGDIAVTAPTTMFPRSNQNGAEFFCGARFENQRIQKFMKGTNT